MPKSICLFFKVHQPFQLKRYQYTDIEVSHLYEDPEADQATLNRLADECYLPANEVILDLIRKNEGRFKVSYSISGTALELFMKYRPDLIRSFKDLLDTGSVELLGETYYNSLSYLYSRHEFVRQIEKHSAMVEHIFGLRPVIFRNTELIYDNQLAAYIHDLGYKGILCEGIERILGGRSTNKIYSAPGIEGLALFLRNMSLSNDIAFHFDNVSWNEFPLTADKFAGWLHAHPEDTEVINLFIDYETFGIHKKISTGIFEFLKHFPKEALANPEYQFELPGAIAAAIEGQPPVYDVPQMISWGNKSQLDAAWSQNVMQNNTLKKIYSLEKIVRSSGSVAAIDTWGKLQSADFFYYMIDNHARGDRYKYVSPFSSAEEIYRYYTNIVVDFEITLIRKLIVSNKNPPLKELEIVNH